MTPINFKVGDEEYQLLPHTGFEAIDLDRKVLGVIGRMAMNGAINLYEKRYGASFIQSMPDCKKTYDSLDETCKSINRFIFA